MKWYFLCCQCSKKRWPTLWCQCGKKRWPTPTRDSNPITPAAPFSAPHLIDGKQPEQIRRQQPAKAITNFNIIVSTGLQITFYSQRPLVNKYYIQVRSRAPYITLTYNQSRRCTVSETNIHSDQEELHLHSHKRVDSSQHHIGPKLRKWEKNHDTHKLLQSPQI